MLVEIDDPWLRRLPRFIAGLERRLERLKHGGHRRDAELTAQLRPLETRFRAAWAVADPARRETLAPFRWLLEELRVGLFAQELGTAVKVSVPRLEAAWRDLAG
jgi:ATP-dependent helicase HrpA